MPHFVQLMQYMMLWLLQVTFFILTWFFPVTWLVIFPLIFMLGQYLQEVFLQIFVVEDRVWSGNGLVIFEWTSMSRKFLFLQLLKTSVLSCNSLIAQNSRSGQFVVITFLNTSQVECRYCVEGRLLCFTSVLCGLVNQTNQTCFIFADLLHWMISKAMNFA